MTLLSEIILKSYQVRKTKKQKQSFINVISHYHPEVQVQEGGFPKSRNLIFGDVEKASVILSAHYDTCAALPFPNFITPKNIFISVLYGIALVIPFFVGVMLINFLLGMFTYNYWIHYSVSVVFYFGLLFCLFGGPANKHTANDNTSGVITLLEILEQMSAEDLEKTAIVLFDNEEIGLLGSGLFRKKYKEQMQNKLLVNFDCVSDGNNILLSATKAAREKYADKLECCFTTEDNKQFMHEKAEHVYYPSDQAGFPVAVAVAALKHNRFIGYYMDRIHTSRDTVFDEENIALLCKDTLSFLRTL